MTENQTYETLIKKLTQRPVQRYNVEWRFLEENLARWTCEKSLAPLNLDPEFQRLHVWTEDQQTKYVEFILNGGQTGKEIYFNCVGWSSSYEGPFVIVDGKQRLQAVRQFLTNQLPIFGGFYKKDIGGYLPSNAEFLFNINNLSSEAEVIRWYLEMNTGGTPHTPAEIEKAKQLLKEKGKP